MGRGRISVTGALSTKVASSRVSRRRRTSQAARVLRDYYYYNPCRHRSTPAAASDRYGVATFCVWLVLPASTFVRDTWKFMKWLWRNKLIFVLMLFEWPMAQWFERAFSNMRVLGSIPDSSDLILCCDFLLRYRKAVFPIIKKKKIYFALFGSLW